MFRKLLVLGVVLTAAGAGAYWWLSQPFPAVAPLPPIDTPAAGEPESPEAKAGEPVSPEAKARKPESPEAKARKPFLGVWQDEYKGKRTMTLNADGSGVMHVELSGFNAIFGSKLRFDMRWELRDNKLVKKTIGGEPPASIKAILLSMGDTAEDTIVTVSEQQLLLLDKDGAQKYDWKRVPKDR